MGGEREEKQGRAFQLVGKSADCDNLSVLVDAGELLRQFDGLNIAHGLFGFGSEFTAQSFSDLRLAPLGSLRLPTPCSFSACSLLSNLSLGIHIARLSTHLRRFAPSVTASTLSSGTSVNITLHSRLTAL